ncbi:uncharacterized protein ISCGN_009908 [Ixodes scapularis]
MKRDGVFSRRLQVKFESSYIYDFGGKQLRDALSVATQSLQWLLYSGVQQLGPAAPVLPIQDDDLWSKNARDVVEKHMESLPTLTDEEREEVTRFTVGKANNARWHEEWQGRITASVCSAVIKCVKPEYLVKGILYPSPDASSEVMRYGRTHEGTAVAAYASLMAAFDTPVEIRETGLHIHPECSFIAASPDRIVMKDNEEGLLEVKCPASKIGLTPMEACKDKKFCCEVVDGLVRLKKTHAYQVQGQMAVTGHQRCNLVFWTNNKTVANSTHVETITFDKKFVDGVVTGRVRRQRTLLARGKYVSFKKFCKGFYVVEDGPGLKKKLRCGDGIQIAIRGPSENDPRFTKAAYWCRKDYYALNAMIVCDADLYIQSIDATFPGSVHDSFVWRMSILRETFLEGHAVREGVPTCRRRARPQVGAFKKVRFPSSGAPESPSESTAEAPDAVNVSQEDTDACHVPEDYRSEDESPPPEAPAKRSRRQSTEELTTNKAALLQAAVNSLKSARVWSLTSVGASTS